MLRLFRIRGQSLSPEYQSGDFVVTSKIPFLFVSPQPGDVIAFRHPAFGLLIKQVDQFDSSGRMLTVRGTSPESVDSREFGPIPVQRMIGKVIWHVRSPQ